MSSASSSSASAGPSLAGRFAAAIALTIGFYVLALALAAALIGLPILGFMNGRFNLWLSLTCLFLGGSILYAIVPRRLRFSDPGPKITETDEPQLMKMIAEEAKAAGEPVPEDVYLTMEVNAAVMQRSRTHRVMIVGIPLLHILTERQVRGVIAHEFGHYSGGDTRLGPWIYRTRETIGRTIVQLSDDEGDDSWSQKAVRLPFIWYGKAFLRITAAISRRQEFAADRCAVGRAGRATYAEALRKVHSEAAAWDGFWMEEVVPVLESGRRPPVGEGFRHFTEADAVEEAIKAHLKHELEESKTDAYDSHPSLPERLAAIEDQPAGEDDDSPCAIGLLADPDAAERRVLDFLIGPQASEFRPVAWDEVGVARARHMTQELHQVVAGITLGDLPSAVKAIPQTARQIAGPDDDSSYVMEFVAGVLGDGVLLALHAAGWTVEAPPAQPVTARREETVLVPHAAVHKLRTDELSADEWRQCVEDLGVAELPLGEPAAQSSEIRA
jgi:Zn-dependent protease with chaperone function